MKDQLHLFTPNAAAIRQQLSAIQHEPSRARELAQNIHSLMLGRRHIRTGDGRGNFTKLSDTDLEAMYELYDDLFFSGLLKRSMAEMASAPLVLRVATRMTSAGGKTYRQTYRIHRGQGLKPKPSYEIAISMPLLMQTFDDVKRPISVCGVTCTDRLSAMQRIFEHELIHLCEMLGWDQSSCRKPRFKSLVWKLFGHTEVTHQLVTQAERAMHKGIRVGDRVRFELDRCELVGVVNRITRRATVLVEDRRGQRFDDGKRYARYYVPLERLQRCGY